MVIEPRSACRRLCQQHNGLVYTFLMLGDANTTRAISIKFEVIYYCFERHSRDALAVECATKTFHGLMVDNTSCSAIAVSTHTLNTDLGLVVGCSKLWTLGMRITMCHGRSTHTKASRKK